jgi:hypothetical protein
VDVEDVVTDRARSQHSHDEPRPHLRDAFEELASLNRHYDEELRYACSLLSQARMANDSPQAWEDWWSDVTRFLTWGSPNPVSDGSAPAGRTDVMKPLDGRGGGMLMPDKDEPVGAFSAYLDELEKGPADGPEHDVILGLEQLDWLAKRQQRRQERMTVEGGHAEAGDCFAAEDHVANLLRERPTTDGCLCWCHALSPGNVHREGRCHSCGCVHSTTRSDVERDRLYGVWDGPEDEYSGYVYLDESLAKQHAEAVYGGRVVRMTLYRKLAPWVAEMSAGSAEGDTK